MRYRFSVCYIGSKYSGFQIQDNKDTIQYRLESALSVVCKQTIKVISSGRTDAGVSAKEQVCHFDIDEQLTTNRVLSYTNSLLPEDIRILDMIEVDNSFHARYSAKQKTYEYYFYTGKKNPIYDSFATYTNPTLDIDAMMRACQDIVGTHDFTAFCASNTSVVDKTRTIYEANIKLIDNDLYKFTVIGNGFLYNMVRILMGTLVTIGQGKISYKDIKKIIVSKDRSLAGKTMPAKGLMLKKVVY